MPVLLSLVTEDEILDKANEKTDSSRINNSEKSFQDPKARQSFKAALEGRTLLQRLTEEKTHD